MHEIVIALESDLDHGLTSQEAAARLARIGRNELPSHPKHGPAVHFLLQFHSPLIYVLIASGLVTALIGDVVESSVIFAVVLVNATVGFVQERRADAALEALARNAHTFSNVRRDGTTVRIDSRLVVPGDVVSVGAGDKVPADLRLFEVASLQIDESALTGESLASVKSERALPAGTLLGDRANMAYSSTLVTAGSGTGLAVATGEGTEIGRIHELVGKTTSLSTPLTRKLDRFSRWLTVVILVLAGVTLATGVGRGEPLGDMVTAAVALAVGAIPEGLPAAVTIVLAIGVYRMAKRHAIIRELPAAETLGSTSVICTDKTGTLTRNEMAVEVLGTPAGMWPLPDAPLADVRELLLCGAYCNDAHLAIPPGSAAGDPTEVALLRSAELHGLLTDGWRTELRRIDELPFSSETKMMATMHDVPALGRRRVLVKGALESVLKLCPEAEVEAAQQQASEMSAAALRVLAFARCEVPVGWRLSAESLDALHMEYLGLQGMSDPPRDEAVRAVEACRSAGIDIKMITGDHPTTAVAIARRIGLTDGEPRAVGAQELDPETSVKDLNVFARVSAEQKLLIVRGLQRDGEVVAMTGDGINDAPALKKADIGVAMGISGTEVAKEAADMVLTDDNFASIEAAVEEGRSVFDNLTKFIVWTLPTNFGEGLIVMVAVLLGTQLPILPVQILWVNMITAVGLGLMLAFEPKESDVMTRPPRRLSDPILSARLVVRIVIAGTLIMAVCFAVFQMEVDDGHSLDVARTLTVNALVAMEIGYLLNCRVLQRSVLTVGLLSNRWVLVGVAVTVLLQAALTYAPWLNAAFGTAPLSLWHVALLAAIGACFSLTIGVVKWIEARVWPSG